MSRHVASSHPACGVYVALSHPACQVHVASSHPACGMHVALSCPACGMHVASSHPACRVHVVNDRCDEAETTNPTCTHVSTCTMESINELIVVRMYVCVIVLTVPLQTIV